MVIMQVSFSFILVYIVIYTLKKESSEIIKRMTKMLKIKANLLPWYNELSDIVETEQKGFPKKILSKIVAFGQCKLDYIDKKEAHFVLISKKYF
jgi:2-phospho-L-lactate transferase/gluconeogenesis factor (CofD/UPF0052 family)